MRMVISMFLKIKMPETSVKDEFVSSFEIFSYINLHASCKTCGDKSCTFKEEISISIPWECFHWATKDTLLICSCSG